MAATRAGTPSLVRLKSILRYSRLAPPPRWRAVLRPSALRPPDFLRPSTRVFSGSVFVNSAKSGNVMNRRPAEVGFGLRIGILGPDDRGGVEGLLHGLISPQRPQGPGRSGCSGRARP